MKLYNTLTRQIDEFKPLDQQQASIYTCGPTVYDRVTIGNLSAFIIADTWRRAAAFGGQHVKHVMNLTDIDDKTVARSHAAYPELEPLAALRRLTEEQSGLFNEDMVRAGNDLNAITFIRATDSITEMQAIIRQLYEQGFAYEADDGIYFSIKEYQASGKRYGQLSQITASSTAVSRIQNDEYDKEAAQDFALWKAQKSGEPAWDFELAGKNIKGRPGWHIECSAMSRTLLGQPFDIHTGGIDLIFPHHENEIAQSTAGQENPLLAKYFIHNEHMLVDGRKMSKSLGNIYTLEDVEKHGYDPLAFRLLVLQSHYRNQTHFSWESLEAAQNRLQDFRAMAVLRYQAQPVVHDSGTFSLEDVPVELAGFLQSDLDTPQALAFLSQVSLQLQTVLIETDMVDHFENMLRGIDELLGLQLTQLSDITGEQKQWLQKREAARKAKDWAAADELRSRLSAAGIGVRDTHYGPIWFPQLPA